jgi:hypothetical protein
MVVFNHGNDHGDGTQLSAHIALVPEPGMMLLFLIGVMSLRRR